MITPEELAVLWMCLEGLLYGKISVQCTLTCTLLKKSNLFPGPGIYSGIFAIYLQCTLKESRTTTIIFYALCLLYILSTATIVSDLLASALEVSKNSIYKNVIFLLVMQLRVSTLLDQSQIDFLSIIIYRLLIFQGTVTGCCDFIAQCTLVRMNYCTYLLFYSPKSSKIYRCWIVWGENIRVVIVPSFLAIAYIGQ